jgi:hypothetical protein
MVSPRVTIPSSTQNQIRNQIFNTRPIDKLPTQSSQQRASSSLPNPRAANRSPGQVTDDRAPAPVKLPSKPPMQPTSPPIWPIPTKLLARPRLSILPPRPITRSAEIPIVSAAWLPTAITQLHIFVTIECTVWLFRRGRISSRPHNDKQLGLAFPP